MTRFFFALGLALLYASAYFLDFLSPYSLYFLPSFFDYIVLPSLVAVVVLVPLVLLANVAIRGHRPRRALLFFAAAVLTVIAVKSVFNAAGFPWLRVLAVLGEEGGAPNHFRWSRMLVVGGSLPAALLFMYLIRQSLFPWLRWLSTLGYAFCLLAIYRSISLDLVFPASQPATDFARAAEHAQVAARRVVWVIFDEMDYGLSLDTRSGMASSLPNFSRLSAAAISATKAFSPGRDTLYSIPALLSGTGLSGITIAPQNKLVLFDRAQQGRQFGPNSALFSRLPAGPKSATVLGFYHPYCKIFPELQACHSTYFGNAGRWYDSLTFFSEPLFSAARRTSWANHLLPEVLLYQFDPMYRISKQAMGRLAHSLQNPASSLDFIHLNFPHLPNVYMRRLLQQPLTTDVHAYEQNLVGADMVLGSIVHELQAMAKKQDILLIVSSDHWLRTHSTQAATVPFIAWKVGAAQPFVLNRPFNTGYTGALAINFLEGKLVTQAAMADWLSETEFYPTWSAPEGYRY